MTKDKSEVLKDCKYPIDLLSGPDTLEKMPEKVRKAVLRVLHALNNPKAIGADLIDCVKVSDDFIHIHSFVSKWSTYKSAKVSDDYLDMMNALRIKERDSGIAKIIEKQGYKVVAISPEGSSNEIKVESLPHYEVILNTSDYEDIALIVTEISPEERVGLRKLVLILDRYEFEIGNINLRRVLKNYNIEQILPKPRASSLWGKEEGEESPDYALMRDSRNEGYIKALRDLRTCISAKRGGSDHHEQAFDLVFDIIEDLEQGLEMEHVQ